MRETNVTNLLNINRIIIDSADDFRSLFLNKNIESLYFFLDDKNKNDANQYILNKKYVILLNGIIIYTGIISYANIFPVEDIPLYLLTYHKIKIVIFDVEVPIDENDYYF